MKLLGNRVWIQPLPKTIKGMGGILYPESYQDDQMRYRVLGVGPGRQLKNGTIVPPEVKAGDNVLAPLYHEHTILPDGTRIIDAKEILAVW